MLSLKVAPLLEEEKQPQVAQSEVKSPISSRTGEQEEQKQPRAKPEDKNTLQEVEAAIDELQPNKDLRGHTKTVQCLKVWGQYLFSGSWDSAVKVWSLETLTEVTSLIGRTDWVQYLQVSNNYLFSGSRDNTVKVWSLETLTEVTSLIGHTDWVQYLQVSNNYLFSGLEITQLRCGV